MAKWDAPKRLLLGFVLVGVGICGYAYFYSYIDVYLHGGITVTIINKCGSNLGPVAILYAGGIQTISQLPADGQASVKIRVTGESGLSIRYLDHSGNSVSLPLDVYMEQGDLGSVEVTINADNTIRLVQDVYDIFEPLVYGNDHSRFEDTTILLKGGHRTGEFDTRTLERLWG